MNKHALFVMFSASLALAACGKEEVAKTDAPDIPVADIAAMEQQAHEQVTADLVPGTDITSRKSGYDTYVAKCVGCHGDSGQGTAGNPKLSGLSRADVAARLADYRAGKALGPNTAVMAKAARGLDDASIEALAGYIGE